VNEEAIIKYIHATFDGITSVTVSDNSFFFYDPEQKFPFATLMTNDDNDQFSNLNRPGVCRLNIGVSKATFRALFGAPSSDAGEAVTSDYDFTALDKLMPHPVYGKMYWVCILNPGPATFQKVVQPLLAEAYDMAVNKYAKKVNRA
jgi:hypothetical protein